MTYFTSLLPFALIWEIPGGAQWRFTLHAEPYLLIAAAFATVTLARAASAGVRGELRLAEWRPFALRGGITVACLGALAFLIAAFPLLFVVTDVANGRPTSVAAGPRDGFYFNDGWHPPERRGAVTFRDSRASRARLWFPAPAPRPLHSIPESPGVTLEATLNGTSLGSVELVADPESVMQGLGRYVQPVAAPEPAPR